jgi:pimeloyl-ACP methyl ester carboxylesterase
MIESPRGNIEYDESGTGPTVVLAPGSCSTGAAWRPIMSRWENRFRCVTTSLLGYGRTAERRTVGDTGINHEADILEAVVLRAGGPVHLVGHSFGGLTALAVALRHRVPLLSLVIIEAPAPDVLRQAADHRHCRAIRDMTQAYFGAFESGEEEAIQVMIDFFSGPGTFAGWPERVRDYAIRTTAVNILDWQTAHEFPLSPATLAKVAVPTLVLRGGASHPAIRRANELLAHGMANASLTTLAGAAHFMISTHPKEVAAIIALHIASTERGPLDHLRRSASSPEDEAPFLLRKQTVQLPPANSRNSRP